MPTFQSTRPSRGATKAPPGRIAARSISIHAPLAGRDLLLALRRSTLSHFNPRAPRGARLDYYWPVFANIGISIHAPLAGRDSPLLRHGPGDAGISIHAPLAGRDAPLISVLPMAPISIHAPLAGRDVWFRLICLCSSLFQSTRPSRGATRPAGRRSGAPDEKFQSTRPLQARRSNQLWCDLFIKFQSTRPLRGATAKVHKLLYTLLRKKARFQPFLQKAPPFKAFFRLRISKNISNRGANRHGNFCALLLRTTRSLGLSENKSACSQSARSCFHTFFPGSKIAGYPSPDP